MKFRFVEAATDELEEAIAYSRANFGLGDEQESETVIFYAFGHTSRRPGYWKPRISSLP
jgi:hypothetical protein